MNDKKEETVQSRTNKCYQLIMDLMSQEGTAGAGILTAPGVAKLQALQRFATATCKKFTVTDIPTLCPNAGIRAQVADIIKNGFVDVDVAKLDGLTDIMTKNPLRYVLLRNDVEKFACKIQSKPPNGDKRGIPSVYAHLILDEVADVLKVAGLPDVVPDTLVQSLFQYSIMSSKNDAASYQLNFLCYDKNGKTKNKPKSIVPHNLHDMFVKFYRLHTAEKNGPVATPQRVSEAIFKAMPLALCDFVFVDSSQTILDARTKKERSITADDIGRSGARCFHLLVGVASYDVNNMDAQTFIAQIRHRRKEGVTVIRQCINPETAAVCAFYARLCSLFPDDEQLLFDDARGSEDVSIDDVYQRVINFLTSRPSCGAKPLGDCTQSTEPRQFSFN